MSHHNGDQKISEAASGNVSQQAAEACSKERFKGGIHLAPKDLRDYFCTEIAAKSDDPNVAAVDQRKKNLQPATDL